MDQTYLSDTELYMKIPLKTNTGNGATSRGGGFRMRPNNELGGATSPFATSLNEQSSMQRKELTKLMKSRGVLPDDVVHGTNFSFFCPKRFNRYPRFTIFFKKNQQADQQQAEQFQVENTVSLAP